MPELGGGVGCSSSVSWLLGIVNVRSGFDSVAFFISGSGSGDKSIISGTLSASAGS